MAQATFYWTETYYNTGTSASVTVPGDPPSASIPNADFLFSQGTTYGQADPNTYYTTSPIPVPLAGSNFSYEKWIRGYWAFGSNTNLISNVHVYNNVGNGMQVGQEAAKIYAAVRNISAYRIPSNSSANRNTGAGTVPFLQYVTGAWTGATAANTGGGNLGVTLGNTKVTLNNGQASLAASGYSDYMVFQLEVPSTVTTPGDIGVQAIKLQWDEQ